MAPDELLYGVELWRVGREGNSLQALVEEMILGVASNMDPGIIESKDGTESVARVLLSDDGLESGDKFAEAVSCVGAALDTLVDEALPVDGCNHSEGGGRLALELRSAYAFDTPLVLTSHLVVKAVLINEDDSHPSGVETVEYLGSKYLCILKLFGGGSEGSVEAHLEGEVEILLHDFPYSGKLENSRSRVPLVEVLHQSPDSEVLVLHPDECLLNILHVCLSNLALDLLANVGNVSVGVSHVLVLVPQIVYVLRLEVVFSGYLKGFHESVEQIEDCSLVFVYLLAQSLEFLVSHTLLVESHNMAVRDGAYEGGLNFVEHHGRAREDSDLGLGPSSQLRKVRVGHVELSDD